MSQQPEDLHNRFSQAYDDHVDEVFRYVFFRLRNRERALEITQEAFLKTWNYLSKGKEVDNIRAFLFKVAHNLYVNDIRYRSIRSTFSLDKLSEEGFEPVSHDGRDVVNEQDEHREVLDKLSSVPGRYREALSMRYIDGLGIPEIARALGISEGNASVKIHRGLQKLKELYGQ